MEPSAGIAAQAAMTRQTIALSVLKQSADMEKKLASILEAAVSSVPVSSLRGSALNIQA